MKWLMGMLACLAIFSCGDSTRNQNEKDINRLVANGGYHPNIDNEKSFIVKAVDDVYAFIEVAELGQLKGTSMTSSQATALKDGHVAILYQLIDYADVKAIALPETNSNNQALHELGKVQKNFDVKWQREAIRQNEAMIDQFENFKTSDTNLRGVINEVLTTLRFNRTVLSEYVAQNN